MIVLNFWLDIIAKRNLKRDTYNQVKQDETTDFNKEVDSLLLKDGNALLNCHLDAVNRLKADQIDQVIVTYVD